MNNFDRYFKNDLLLFHQATSIPFCVFDSDKKVLLRCPIIDSFECSSETMHRCIERLKDKQDNNHIPILISSNNCFTALLSLNYCTYIMFGPVSPMQLSYREFLNTNRQYSTLDDLTHFYRVIQQSPHISLHQFIAGISIYIRLVFQENLSFEEIVSDTFLLTQNSTGDLEDIYSKITFITGNEAAELEKKIFIYIQNGNIKEIKEIFETPKLFSRREAFPASVLELQKDFIAYAAVCCNIAVNEGLETQKAFSIFDRYTSQVTNLNELNQFTDLFTGISTDYCRQTASLHDKNSLSPVVNKCIRYIKTHLHTKITVKKLAEHCNLSERTIIRHFSEYHNQSVIEYILTLKLEEAAFLLANSKFTLAEISNQLAFSSQSHFSAAFKKKYCYTPQQYRNKYQK